MSFDYDIALADNISRVRFQVQDTEEFGRYFENEEIEYLLEVYKGNVYKASADLALSLWSRFQQEATVAEVDDIRLEMRDRSKFYENLYKELKKKAATNNSTIAPIFVGGADRRQFVANSEGRPHQDLGKVDTFFDLPKNSY